MGRRGSTKSLAELKGETREFCEARCRALLGPGFIETVAASHSWIERCNEDERAAHAAVVALRQGLQLAHQYLLQYPVDGSWSNHGQLLRDARTHLDALTRLPLLRQARRAAVWDGRNAVVQLYDKVYGPTVLRERSSRRAEATRLTPTELAWISIVSGNWPGRCDATWKVSAVIREETKDIDRARVRHRKAHRPA